MAEDYKNHHFVPQWYQKKFMLLGQTEYYHLDLHPAEFTDSKGGKHFANAIKNKVL